MSTDDSPLAEPVKPPDPILRALLIAAQESILDEQAVALRPALIRTFDGDVALAALYQQLTYREAQERGVEKFEDDDGRGWWVDATRTEIAGAIGISETQARRLIEKARSMGLIETAQPFAGRHDRRLFARICRVERPESTDPEVDIDPRLRSISTLLPIEGFKEVSLEENTARDDFETWWLGYPKRAGSTRGPKKPARAAWDRLSAADRAAAVRAVPHYAEATDQKFVCDAVRFLTQRRFDEWQEPGRPRGSSWAGPRGRGPEHPLTKEEREAW